MSDPIPPIVPHIPQTVFAPSKTKRQRTSSHGKRSYTKVKNPSGDVFTIPELHTRYKHTIEQLGWILLAKNNHNRVNSFKIEISNIMLAARTKLSALPYDKQQETRDELNIIVSHLTTLSEFVNAQFATGFFL